MTIRLNPSKEILNLIKKIDNAIEEDKISKALRLSEELMKYKPTNLVMLNARARALFKSKNYEEVIKLYEDVIQYNLIGEDEIVAANIIFQARNAIDTLSPLTFRDENILNYMKFSMQDEEGIKNIADSTEKLQRLEEEVLINLNDQKKLLELANKYFHTLRYVESAICFTVYISRKGNTSYEKYLENEISLLSELKEQLYACVEMRKNYRNFALMMRQIMNYDYPSIFVVSQPCEHNSIKLCAELMATIDKKVYLIDELIQCEADNDKMNLKETVKVSLENKIENNNLTVIHPAEIYVEGNCIGNNIAHIVSHIKENSSRKYCLLFESSIALDQNFYEPTIRKDMHRITPAIGDVLWGGFLAAGHIGEYKEFMSQLYGSNVVLNMDKDSEVGISVILPVRNNTTTFRHTLKTCLNQRIDDYEIVVGDNSAPENNDVYNLVCEFDSPKIKYFRTPRNLPINRSFEYAFLQARGEFLTSLGGDDGIYFHGLEYLDKVLKAFPNEDIIWWDRDAYIWPEYFQIPQLRNLFAINRMHQKGKIEAMHIETFEILMENLKTGSQILNMPTLYSDSGMKRRYFTRLLKETGRLFDGITPDLHMGCTNLALNKKILKVTCPITLGGASEKSTGAEANKKSKSMFTAFTEGGGMEPAEGLPVSSAYQNLIHNFTTGNLVIFYDAFFQNLNTGCNIEYFNINIDWENTFKQLLNDLSPLHFQYDKIFKNLIYSAQNLKNETSKPLDILSGSIKTLRYIEEKNISITPASNFTMGFNESGRLCLDASLFNVSNIYEACELFEKIYNL